MGALGGIVTSYVFLSLGFRLGRSGYSGLEYTGFRAPEMVLWLSLRFGAVAGAVLFAVGYGLMRKRLSLPAIVAVSLASTLAGGAMGALASPVAAALLAAFVYVSVSIFVRFVF